MDKIFDWIIGSSEPYSLLVLYKILLVIALIMAILFVFARWLL